MITEENEDGIYQTTFYIDKIKMPTVAELESEINILLL